jgi:hypothetical protein
MRRVAPHRTAGTLAPILIAINHVQLARRRQCFPATMLSF